MNKRTSVLIALVLVFGLTSAYLLYAQQRAAQPRDRGSMMSQGMMDGMMGMMCPMMGGSAPAVLLAERQRLGLTNVQVSRLEPLAAAERAAMERLMPEKMRAYADLMEAAGTDVKVAQARTALERAGRAHTDMMIAHLQARADARNVLTPEQRTKADAGTRSMIMHGDSAMAGMMNMMNMCPMMMQGMGRDTAGHHGMTMPDTQVRRPRQ